MSYNHNFYSQPLNPTQESKTQSSLGAWLVVILFSLTILSLIVLGSIGSKILNLVFPLGSFAIGLFLYFRYPSFYIGFMWWNIFLVALIRRVSDFRAGAFTDSNPILLSPSLVILSSLHTIYFNLPKAREQGSAPFVLALISIVYGYFVGLLNPTNSAIKATLSLLGWMTPILFSYHLYINWRRYPEYSRVIKQVFLWGCLIIGIYGIYQYVVAPEWDRLWLVGSGMTSSAGKPEPFGIRVWSTINSPGPFADMMSSGLLILFSCSGFLVLPAAGAGLLSLLLSAVRTSWLGGIGGLIFFCLSLKPKQQMRLVLTIVALLLCVIPLSTMEPFSEVISSRFSTLGDIQNDQSAKDRQGLYKVFFEYGIFNFMGDGLGANDTVDSGIFSLVLDLGWIGALPYTGSLLLCGITLFKNVGRYPKDLFMRATCAVVIKSIAFFLATRVTAGVHGIIIWSFIGIGLAGQKYWNDQQMQVQLSLLAQREEDSI